MANSSRKGNRGSQGAGHGGRSSMRRDDDERGQRAQERGARAQQGNGREAEGRSGSRSGGNGGKNRKGGDR